MFSRGAELNSQRKDNKIVTAFRKQVAALPPSRSLNPFEGLSITRPFVLWSNGRKLSKYIGEYLDESLARRGSAEKQRKSKAVVDLALDMYENELQSGDKKEMDASFRETAIDQ